MNIENSDLIPLQELNNLLREEVMKDMHSFIDNLNTLINFRFDHFEKYLNYSEIWTKIYNKAIAETFYKQHLNIAEINSDIKVMLIKSSDQLTPLEWRIFHKDIIVREFSFIGVLWEPPTQHESALPKDVLEDDSYII